MKLETIVPIVAVLISSIIGPLVMFFVSKRYTDGSVRRSSMDIRKQINDDIIGHHRIALDAMKTTLTDHLKKRSGAGKIELELLLIAVAMKYSWDFIEDELPKILEKDEYSFASFKLKIAFVDSDHLSQLDISKEGTDWADIASKRETAIPEYKKGMSRDFGNRFACEFRTYENIPHWHGWLIRETTAKRGADTSEYLFLGRTKWEHYHKNGRRRKQPKLTVGQNEYRYFTNETTPGASRINLFVQWHTYYFERAFTKKIGANRT